jgi:hypothetical protein
VGLVVDVVSHLNEVWRELFCVEKTCIQEGKKSLPRINVFERRLHYWCIPQTLRDITKDKSFKFKLQ